jgi:hypothetical protein
MSDPRRPSEYGIFPIWRFGPIADTGVKRGTGRDPVSGGQRVPALPCLGSTMRQFIRRNPAR